MSNVSAARTAFNLAMDKITNSKERIDLGEAKLIAAGLLDGLKKIDGDGMLELSRMLQSKSLEKPAHDYLQELYDTKSELSKTELEQLLAMDKAFDPTEGPKDGSKPLTKVQVDALYEKLRSGIDDAMEEIRDNFVQRAAGNDEYSYNDAQVFAMKDSSGKMLGYAVFATGGWDTQIDGWVVFLSRDGKRLAVAEGDK